MTEPFAWFRYQQGSRVYYDSKKWDDCQPLYTQSASEYERGFIDGMQKQMQSSVDKAVNAMSQPEQEPRNVRERWNVELDGNDLLACFNDHEKGDKCQYERYSPQRTWQGLTNEDMVDCLGESCWDDVVRKAEAKLKEKNT